MKRKSLFLSTALVICALLLNMFAGITVFAADGDTATVIEIDSADDLLAVANDLTASYKLTKDIDLKDGEGNKMAWTPLGTFSGTFDGNGHTISGFTVSGTTTVNAGFFTEITGTVKNLTIADASFYTSTSTYQLGAFAGLMNGTMYACKTANDVTVEKDGNISVSQTVLIGGLVGFAGNADVNAVVSHCENNASVTLNTHLNWQPGYAGGIAGRFADGIMEYCINNGTVTIAKFSSDEIKGDSQIACGGIVAWYAPWNGVSGTLNNCINNGEISALVQKNSACAGGIVGTVKGGAVASARLFSSNYNLGSVVGNDAGDNLNYVGGVAGRIRNAYSGNGNYSIGTKLYGTDDGNYFVSDSFKTATEKEIKTDATYKMIVAETAEHLTGTHTDFVGYQTSASARDKSATDNTQVFDLRLIAVIGGDISDCTAVGFDVEATYDGLDAPKTTVQSMVTVYDSVTGVADGEPEEYTAADLGGDYIFVLSVRGIPTTATSITFTVTTYYTDSTGTVYSAAETFTVDASSIPTVDMPEIAA